MAVSVLTSTTDWAPVSQPISHLPAPVPVPRWLRFFTFAILSTGVCVTLAVAGVLFAYAVPAFDDFFRVTRQWQGDHDLGWVGFVFGKVYMHWQGRWASCGLEAAVLPHVDVTRHYWALLLGVAVIDVLGIYAGCRWLTRGGSRRLALMMTIVAAALIWASSPSVSEAVYWFTGAVENSMSLALAVLLLVAINAVPPQISNGTKRILILSGLALAGAVVAGFHELYGAMLCIVLAVGLAAVIVNQTQTARLWRIALLGSIVGLVVVILAPGNNHRLAHDSTINSFQVRYDIRLAANIFYRYGRRWLIDPKLIAATLWVALSPSLEAARLPWITARRFNWRIALPLLWLALIAVGFFIPTFIFGNEMPIRTLAGNYVVFALGWLLVVYAWTRPLEKTPIIKTYSKSTAIILAVLGVSLLLSSNFHRATGEFSTRIRPWHQAVVRRYELLRKSTGKDVVVQRLPLPSTILISGELSEAGAEASDNQNVASVFHVNSLTLAPAPFRPTSQSIHPK